MGVRTPIAGSFIMENTIKVDDLGVRQFIPILGPPLYPSQLVHNKGSMRPHPWLAGLHTPRMALNLIS